MVDTVPFSQEFDQGSRDAHPACHFIRKPKPLEGEASANLKAESIGAASLLSDLVRDEPAN